MKTISVSVLCMMEIIKLSKQTINKQTKNWKRKPN